MRDLDGGKTHSQPLGIISFGIGKQRLQRVISGDNKSGKVGEELATQVKEDQEEIEGD
jgi:hypothetical protein